MSKVSELITTDEAARKVGMSRPTLRQLCIEHLGEDAPLPIVELHSGLYLIVDIGLRMLIPRELLNAQFSPELAKDYVLIGTKTQQVKMIGNSVPPLLAAAVVGANPLIDHRERLRRKAG